MNHLKETLDLVSKNSHCDYISLRSMKNKEIYLSVRNEILETSTSSRDEGVMCEVMKGGQISYSATNSFLPSEIKRCVLQAEKAATFSEKFPLFSFGKEVRPKIIGEYKGAHTKGIEDFRPSQMIDLLMGLSLKMKNHPHLINRAASFYLVETESHYLGSNGSDLRQNIVRLSLSLAVTAMNESSSQTRTFGSDLNTQKGMESIDEENLFKTAENLAREALLLLEAPECPIGPRDLILAPDQMFLQIHESIGHPLELDRILGDERNYAGWSFIRPTDFGNLKYGPPLMNIVFDPGVVGENASSLADDIGSLASKEYLIRNGLLERGIGSLESQSRLKLKGVSSQRATSWNRAPIDRMGNINLLPGTSSFFEMIGKVEKGIYMKSNRSWSIDDYRNKFQFGCEYGQLIENGELKGIVKNPNYRGVTIPFWNQLKMVGDPSTFLVGGLTHCGKGEPRLSKNS
jgi:predicted Zn-dependent protease